MGWLWRWLRDEDFWKQITVNVISVGIVGAFAYIFAVAGGYLREPERINPVVSTVVGAVTAVSGYVWVILLNPSLRERESKASKRLNVVTMISTLTFFVSLAIFALILVVTTASLTA